MIIFSIFYLEIFYFVMVYLMCVLIFSLRDHSGNFPTSRSLQALFSLRFHQIFRICNDSAKTELGSLHQIILIYQNIYQINTNDIISVGIKINYSA